MVCFGKKGNSGAELSCDIAEQLNISEAGMAKRCETNAALEVHIGLLDISYKVSQMSDDDDNS